MLGSWRILLFRVTGTSTVVGGAFGGGGDEEQNRAAQAQASFGEPGACSAPSLI